MKLRALEQQDYQNWLLLWQGYQAFYKVEIDHKVTEKTFSRLLDPNEDMYCLVVGDQDTLIGFVHFIFHRSTWTTGDYCYLQDLFVDQHSRPCYRKAFVLGNWFHELANKHVNILFQPPFGKQLLSTYGLNLLSVNVDQQINPVNNSNHL